MWTSLRIKIRDFWKKNKYKIIVAILAFLILVFINNYMKTHPAEPIHVSNYKPNEPAVVKKTKIPEKEKEPVNETIDRYIQYCNNKEYEKAYNMLSDECKQTVYPDIEDYKEYIDLLFDQKKIYNLQNLANKKNEYLYRVRILDDILATGSTGEAHLFYDEDIFTLIKVVEEYKIGIRRFIKKEEINKLYEDDYMKMKLLDRVVQYDAETYTVEITNRSEYTLVFADFTENKEIALKVGSEYIGYQKDLYNVVVIRPGQSTKFQFTFGKSYSLSKESEAIIFNAVRILKTYTGNEETKEEEINNAEKLYSFSFNL